MSLPTKRKLQGKDNVVLYKNESLIEVESNYTFHFKGIHYIHTNWKKKVIITMSNSPEMAL